MPEQQAFCEQSAVSQQSLFIEDNKHQLHLRHIYQQQGGVPVLMVHGAIENGRIFYTETGKGFACFLARQGFDVYVLDLRGRGKSSPKINAESDHGQFESITKDLPLFIDYVHQLTQQPMHVVCHSWGGVLMASVLVRDKNVASKVRSNVCFGTKRQVTVKSFERFVKLNLVWNRLALSIAKRKGYFDAKKYRIGADNETLKSLSHSVAWVNKSHWQDPEDGFDYFAAAKGFDWPPTWHLTGINDTVMGNPIDVKVFIEESKNTQAKFSVLSKQAGNLVDYDHIDILTHKKAERDHFPKISEWLKQH
ncbi:alpha/beta fold hydrolase [Thalassotalea aquiviva]|uniref:alpha/beta fold hydrolase n=1 Tax=Thalassotalea aquiviva TaxID=3242415 RepID=UPI00352B815A